MGTKQNIIDKSNRSVWKSKKAMLALITLANSIVVFILGLLAILHTPEAASAIVNLCSAEIQFIAGVMSATVLGISVLDYKTVTSLENISKSETIHNVTEYIEKTLRPKNVDTGEIE